jgi:hypothetical protein
MRPSYHGCRAPGRGAALLITSDIPLALFKKDVIIRTLPLCFAHEPSDQLPVLGRPS